jgi:hypothetical protein
MSSRGSQAKAGGYQCRVFKKLPAFHDEKGLRDFIKVIYFFEPIPTGGLRGKVGIRAGFYSMS